MKLIDLLVRELPKHGGWPIGAEICAQDNDGEVYFYANSHIRRGGNNLVWSIPELGENQVVKRRIFMKQAEDMAESITTRGQYEAALAASTQVEWDGRGLPPVGCECEYAFIANYKESFCRGKVIAYGESNVFMQHWASKNEFIQSLDKINFRHIRSESERKRDRFIDLLMTEWAFLGQDGEQAGELYDAIAAGKIPGLKLAD